MPKVTVEVELESEYPLTEEEAHSLRKGVADGLKDLQDLGRLTPGTTTAPSLDVKHVTVQSGYITAF